HHRVLHALHSFPTRRSSDLARALLALPKKQQAEVAKKVVDGNLTVRETEHLVKMLLSESGKAKIAKKSTQKDQDVLNLERDLSEDRKSTRLNSSHVSISYAV